MSIRDTRAGFTQAKFNDDASSLVIFEILVIAVAFGIGMQSWWWGGGIFLGGMIVIVNGSDAGMGSRGVKQIEKNSSENLDHVLLTIN